MPAAVRDSTQKRQIARIAEEGLIGSQAATRGPLSDGKPVEAIKKPRVGRTEIISRAPRLAPIREGSSISVAIKLAGRRGLKGRA